MRRGRAGFTLVEVLAGMAVAGVLLAVLVPRLQGVVRAARTQAALGSARSLQSALARYCLDHGDFPTPQQVPDYAGLRSALAAYLALPDDPDQANFTFTRYTSSASSGNRTGNFSLVLADRNQPPTAITVAEGGVTATPPPGGAPGGGGGDR